MEEYPQMMLRKAQRVTTALDKGWMWEAVVFVVWGVL